MNISDSAVSGIHPIETPISTVPHKGARAATPGGTIADQVELSALAVQLTQARNAGTANANIAQAAGQVSGGLVDILA